MTTPNGSFKKSFFSKTFLNRKPRGSRGHDPVPPPPRELRRVNTGQRSDDLRRLNSYHPPSRTSTSSNTPHRLLSDRHGSNVDGLLRTQSAHDSQPSSPRGKLTRSRKSICIHCPSVFAQTKQLNRHLRIAHGKLRQFACTK